MEESEQVMIVSGVTRVEVNEGELWCMGNWRGDQTRVRWYGKVVTE